MRRISLSAVGGLLAGVAMLVAGPGPGAWPAGAHAAGAPLSAGDDAVAAFSMRRVVEGYAGPAVTVRRSSDDATRAIGFAGDGELDAGALLDFVDEPAAGVGVARPLDAIGGAQAAYSLRRLRTGYSGPAVRVRRSSDNAERDIGFTASGDLDTAALTAFVNAVPDSSPASSRPLDDVGVSAAAAYGLRKLRNGYAGNAVRVRRSADNAESDIGFTVGGGLDTGALTSFCGAGSCFVRTWYDQSGNTRNLAQATAGNQPRIVNAGAVETFGGQPTVRFIASASTGLVASFPLSAPVTVVGTLNPLAFNAPNSMWLDGTNGDSLIFRQRSTTTGDVYAGAFLTQSYPWQAGTPMQSSIVFSGGSSQAWKNGVSVAAGVMGSSNAGGISLGSWTGGGRPSDVQWSELIVAAAPLSHVDRQTLEYAQAAHYGTGYPSRAASGFVSTWYDQSGNGRDATFDRAASVGSAPATGRLRIVDAGVVNTTNGRPTLVAASDRTGVATDAFSPPAGGLTLSMVSPAAVSAMRQAVFAPAGLLEGGSGAWQRRSDGTSAPMLGRTARTDNVSAGVPGSGGLIVTQESDGSSHSLRRNGTLGASAGVSGSAQSSPSVLLMGQADGGSIDARLSEVVLAGALTGAERETLETSQSAYYAIGIAATNAAARPLDSLDSAEAAYSLRRLRTGYSGPAVRVRRSSDDTEADIGFTSGGDLDSAALMDFVNAVPAGVPARPLDGVSASAAVAFSLRKLRAAYAGNAIRVRRSSDNAEQDIGFAAGGDLDTGALTSFCGSGSCFVRTWYDQSGNTGRDATQSTAAAQPRIVNAGAIETQGGRPTLRFGLANGVALSGAGYSPFADSTPVAMAAVVNQIAAPLSQFPALFGNTTASGPAMLGTLGTGSAWRQFRCGFADAGFSPAQDPGFGAPTVLSWQATLAGGTLSSTLRVNRGTAATSSLTGYGAQSTGFQIGRACGVSSLNANVPELIAIPATLSAADRDLLEQSQGAYYAITSGFVSRWYDQSGNGRDVVQASAAGQPRIARAGAVEMAGGRPTVRFFGGQMLTVASAPMANAGEMTVSQVVQEVVRVNAVNWRLHPLPHTGSHLPWGDGRAYFDVGGTSGASRVSEPWSAVGTTNVATQRNSVGENTKAMWRNGTLIASGTGTTGPVSEIRLGSDGTSLGANANMSEWALFSSAVSGADRRLLERSQGGYFGVPVAAASMVGLRDGFVSRWHDQSGRGADVVQAVRGRQPRIVGGGVVESVGGRAGLRARSGEWLEWLGAVSGSELDVVMAVRPESPLGGGDVVRFSGDGGPRLAARVGADARWAWDVGGGLDDGDRVSGPGPGAGSVVVLSVTNSVAQSVQRLRVSGWSVAGDEGAQVIAGDRVRVGGDGVDQSVGELLVVPARGEARRGEIEQDVMGRFGVDALDVLAWRSGPVQDAVVTTDTARLAFGAPVSRTGLGGVRCRVDDGAWQTCRSPLELTGLAPGRHTVQVRAVNGIDGQAGPVLTRSWMVQGSSVTDGPASMVEDGDPVAFAFAVPAGTRAQCRLDAGAWEGCESPVRLPGSGGEGEHVFAVRGVSDAGTGPAAVWRWTSAARVATRLTGTPGAYVASRSATFTFAAAREQDALDCRVDGGAWQGCASPHTVTGLADGPHTFQVRAVSPGGRVDGDAPSFAFVVDTEAPSTTLRGLPAGPTFDPRVTLRLGSNERADRYECRVDDAAWEGCAAVHERRLGVGRHVLQARAIDLAGNVDRSPSTAVVQVHAIGAASLGGRAGDGDGPGLRCDLGRPAGVRSIAYRWLRDGKVVAGLRTGRPVRSGALDGSAARCRAIVTFASGETSTVFSPVTLVLGADRLHTLRYPKVVRAGRPLPAVWFVATGGARVDVRVRCRSTGRLCGAQTRTARGGVNRVALGRRLGTGQYTVTVRLTRRTALTRLRTSSALSVIFTVR